jgi:phosphohistidine phosphatase SixA
VLLIRHAWAGHKETWSGDDDRLRPLDERGKLQAAGLVELLEPFAVERILSSPHRRCVQTVEPLAEARGLAIEMRPELGEDRQSTDGRALLRSLVDEDVAVCVHGGAQAGLVSEEASFKKGSAWVLGSGDAARYLPPPA